MCEINNFVIFAMIISQQYRYILSQMKLSKDIEIWTDIWTKITIIQKFKFAIHCSISSSAVLYIKATLILRRTTYIFLPIMVLILCASKKSTKMLR